MSEDSPSEFATLRDRLGLTGRPHLSGAGFLESALPVSLLASEALITVALALSGLMRATGLSGHDDIEVDRHGADTWFGAHARPSGWTPPSPWDPLSGAFATEDGWIRTHANAPRHRAALLGVLGCGEGAEPEEVARRIAGRTAVALETAIVEAGGAAAALRSAGTWAASEAGRAVGSEPLVGTASVGDWDGRTGWSPEPERPLAGVRVLDLTRVIAGPTATQTLATLGADVLRIDPPDWDEPAVLPAVMADKRTARLDARGPEGRSRLHALLADADVLVHGYRAGALDHLGLDAETRHRLRPGLAEVAIRAYGWTGPWTGRRGFDSVAQFATGIAHHGMVAAGADRPVSLPVQALDWATGYLAAAAALTGLTRRHTDRVGSVWTLSLARTAHTLLHLPQSLFAPSPPSAPSAPDAMSDRPTATPGSTIVTTPLGDLEVAASPIRVGPARLRVDRVATELGTDEPRW